MYNMNICDPVTCKGSAIVITFKHLETLLLIVNCLTSVITTIFPLLHMRFRILHDTRFRLYSIPGCAKLLMVSMTTLHISSLVNTKVSFKKCLQQIFKGQSLFIGGRASTELMR